MKKLRYILITAMILFLVIGLWKISVDKDKEYSKTEFVMDTSCGVTFYGNESKAAAEAAFNEISRIDKLMSMYNESSDVSRINSAKAGEKVKVSKDTYYVIETALKICKESKGAFDITVAPLTVLWDFNGENPEIPDDGAIKAELLKVGRENILLENGDTVIKLKSETEIDLGGAAKGYAGDRVLEVAKKYDLTGGIIDLGGNILCFGENPKSKNGKWKVGIQTPFAPTGTYETIVEVAEKAVVTSGTYQRYFEKSGKRYHHILNPKTGYPDTKEYNSVTVVASSSLVADCLATAIYVMGETGEALAEKYNGEVYFE